MLRKLLFVLPLVVAVCAQNTYVSPTYYPGYTPPRTSQPDLPAPFSVPYPVWADQHPLNTSFPVVPGQVLEPGVVYEPKLVFVPKTMEQNATDVAALREPTPVQPEVVTPQPIVTPPPKVIQPVVIPPPRPVQPLPPVTLRPAPMTVRPIPRPQPTIVYPTYPVTRVPPTRPPTAAPVTRPVYVMPTLPPVTRAPPTLPPQTPPTVKRPTSPFRGEFQCPESNGFYSVANSCEAYYECQGFVSERRICPNGLYFNPAARYSAGYTPCAYPSEVHCTSGIVIPRPTQPQPTGQCPAASGLFGIYDGDCSRYMSCQDGLATIMNCPAGLVFNDQVESCDWPVNVPQCTPNVLKDFNCPSPPVERNGEVSDMVYNYRYGSQCRSFVACQRGRPRLLSCDAGLAFDEASQTCISESLVQNCASPYLAASA